VSKKGFTLFELLLVVALIGLFFIFINPNLMRQAKISKEANITTLRGYLGDFALKSNIKEKISFICKGGSLTDCFISSEGGKKLEDGITLKVADKNAFVAYDVKPDGELYEMNFDGLKGNFQKDVILNFAFNPATGISDSFVLYDGKEYFVQDAIRDSVLVFKDSIEAKKAFVKYDKMPINDSKYFFNE